MDGHSASGACMLQTLKLLGDLGVLAVLLWRGPLPINRSQVFDSVSVMRAGMGIQPPRRQDRQGGEKGHGWICPERYGWAQRIWCLHAPDSQTSWRPWRLGGSSLARAIADKPFSSIRFGQRHACRHGNSTAKTPRSPRGGERTRLDMP